MSVIQPCRNTEVRNESDLWLTRHQEVTSVLSMGHQTRCLPLLFTKGMPTALAEFSIEELECFLPYMIGISAKVEGRNVWSLPPWWDSTVQYSATYISVPTYLNKASILRSLVINCYTYHKCLHLIDMSAWLSGLPRMFLKFVKSSDNYVTILFRNSNEPIHTIHTDNLKYDMVANQQIHPYLVPPLKVKEEQIVISDDDEEILEVLTENCTRNKRLNPSEDGLAVLDPDEPVTIETQVTKSVSRRALNCLRPQNQQIPRNKIVVQSPKKRHLNINPIKIIKPCKVVLSPLKGFPSVSFKLEYPKIDKFEYMSRLGLFFSQKNDESCNENITEVSSNEMSEKDGCQSKSTASNRHLLKTLPFHRLMQCNCSLQLGLERQLSCVNSYNQYCTALTKSKRNKTLFINKIRLRATPARKNRCIPEVSECSVFLEPLDNSIIQKYARGQPIIIKTIKL